MGARGPNFTVAEEQILRDHYAKRGARWCAERIPGRTQDSIRSRVRRLGLAQPAADVRRPTNDFIDAIIRRAYTGERPVGFVNACARQVGRTRAWVAGRALELGLIQARDHRPWTQAELDYVSSLALVTPREVSRRMRRRGWQRTPAAVAFIRRTERVERTDIARFTAAGLAEVMGVGTNLVTGWITRGLLRAERRGWNRTVEQKGDGYVIHERDVAQFIVQHPAHVSLAKLEPNKFWLIDLLVRCGSQSSTTGRQRSAERAVA